MRASSAARCAMARSVADRQRPTAPSIAFRRASSRPGSAVAIDSGGLDAPGDCAGGLDAPDDCAVNPQPTTVSAASAMAASAVQRRAALGCPITVGPRSSVRLGKLRGRPVLPETRDCDCPSCRCRSGDVAHLPDRGPYACVLSSAPARVSARALGLDTCAASHGDRHDHAEPSGPAMSSGHADCAAHTGVARETQTPDHFGRTTRHSSGKRDGTSCRRPAARRVVSPVARSPKAPTVCGRREQICRLAGHSGSRYASGRVRTHPSQEERVLAGPRGLTRIVALPRIQPTYSVTCASR